MSDPKSYTASCHCGSIRLSFATPTPIEETGVVSCNCSICHINGYLHTRVNAADITFESDGDALKEYRFGSRNYPHYFCGNCGTSVYVQCQIPGTQSATSINVRTIKGLDTKGLKVKEYDGKSL
ncbi:GFA family protein [Aspergillus clavatus NRRL 1]|uniref:DUF636 domain protein n=1 Tax=Aspergillus clavatus (strain ATCC 1007 / CBS 513.65 / DSM 816 / NCTC 3887 / NRRL 1 / QM 1276 / 107) TaxID=344612 RepID=A1CDG9_ASPCL|nr:DUF636 domain protein [Aspergillus clavatus NRRL 1]EAW11896.1 DUF636 domain protein [Aspergillus clavatus NRRL 1]